MFDVIDGTITTHPTLGRRGQSVALLRFVNGDRPGTQGELEHGEEHFLTIVDAGRADHREDPRTRGQASV